MIWDTPSTKHLCLLAKAGPLIPQPRAGATLQVFYFVRPHSQGAVVLTSWANVASGVKHPWTHALRDATESSMIVVMLWIFVIVMTALRRNRRVRDWVPRWVFEMVEVVAKLCRVSTVALAVLIALTAVRQVETDSAYDAARSGLARCRDDACWQEANRGVVYAEREARASSGLLDLWWLL